MADDESDQDGLEQNVPQHENKLWNIIGGNESDYGRNKSRGNEWITTWRF